MITVVALIVQLVVLKGSAQTIAREKKRTKSTFQPIKFVPLFVLFWMEWPIGNFHSIRRPSLSPSTILDCSDYLFMTTTIEFHHKIQA